MSDKTASQIEHLIEITQQDFELKAGLLEDNIEGDILVAELLQDIKLDVSDIKDGLFQFFEEEQDRFAIQQGLSKEQYFRTLEALREGAGAGGRQAPADTGSGQEGEIGGDTGGAGAVAGAIAGGAAAGGLGRLGSLVFRRIPQLAIIAGAITAGVDYFAEFEEQLVRLKAEGIDPETAMTEAATQAAGKLTADITDLIVEPIGNLGLDLLADELGMTPVQVAEFRESIGELDSILSKSMVGLIDKFVSFFGDETAIGQERQTASEIQDLEEKVVEATEREKRLAQIEEEMQDTTGVDRLKLIAEKGVLTTAQAFTGGSAELEEQLQDTKQRGKLSQAGFAAEQSEGTLDTALQQEFRTEVPSSEKQEWLKENTDPLLRSAAETGAISVQLLERAEIHDAIGQTEREGKLVISGTPLAVENIQALENLSPEQLEAILINDDILLRSRLKGGALDNGTRKIVEYLYRVNSGQIAPSVTTPNLSSLDSESEPVAQMDLGGTVDPGQIAIVGEKGPELVIGPAEVVGREDTSRIFDLLEPSPAVSAIVPVGDMSRNVAATSSTPIVISSTQGGSTVNTMVNNNSTAVLGAGPSARSSDVAARRLQDRMQGVV